MWNSSWLVRRRTVLDAVRRVSGTSRTTPSSVVLTGTSLPSSRSRPLLNQNSQRRSFLSSQHLFIHDISSIIWFSFLLFCFVSDSVFYYFVSFLCLFIFSFCFKFFFFIFFFRCYNLAKFVFKIIVVTIIITITITTTILLLILCHDYSYEYSSCDFRTSFIIIIFYLYYCYWFFLWLSPLLSF